MNSRKRIKVTQMGCRDPANGQVAEVRLNRRDVGSCRRHMVSCRQLSGEPNSTPQPPAEVRVQSPPSASFSYFRYPIEASTMPIHGDFIGE